MLNLGFKNTTRKRSSCAISILEWAGGTVLGERSWRGSHGGETITVARSWLRHRQLYIRHPGKRQPGLTFMGKGQLGSFLFLSPNNFSSSCGANFKQPEESWKPCLHQNGKRQNFLWQYLTKKIW